MPEVLRPNPSGCTKFEGNLFRRGTCRHCLHPWHLHEGVITESDLRSFVASQRQSVQDRAAAEAEAKSKARAKAQAKRRATRAVEDNWFFDDSAQGNVSDAVSSQSDDEERFQMFTGADLARANIERRATAPAAAARPLRIVNLVDFGECDTPAGSSSDARHHSSASAASRPSPPPPPPAPYMPAHSAPKQASAAQDMRGAAFSMPMQSKDDVLLEEISFLRQMLADANEEKNIQVAIVRDELAEKQQMIDDLHQRRVEAEASLKVTRKELDQMRSISHAEARHKDIRAAELRPSEGLSVRRAAAEQEQALLLVESQRQEIGKLREDLRLKEEREWALLTKVKHAEEHAAQQQSIAEDCAAKASEFEQRSIGLSSRLAKNEAELARLLGCETQLGQCRSELQKLRTAAERRSATADILSKVTSEVELQKFQEEIMAMAQEAQQRIVERRVQLKVAALMDGDSGLCKICYDRPACCALLPCRHHSFCTSCARRVESSKDPCPICRREVTGLFETFVS